MSKPFSLVRDTLGGPMQSGREGNGGAGIGRKKHNCRLVGAAAKVHSVAVTLTPETGSGWSEKSMHS